MLRRVLWGKCQGLSLPPVVFTVPALRFQMVPPCFLQAGRISTFPPWHVPSLKSSFDGTSMSASAYINASLFAVMISLWLYFLFFGRKTSKSHIYQLFLTKMSFPECIQDSKSISGYNLSLRGKRKEGLIVWAARDMWTATGVLFILSEIRDELRRENHSAALWVLNQNPTLPPHPSLWAGSGAAVTPETDLEAAFYTFGCRFIICSSWEQKHPGWLDSFQSDHISLWTCRISRHHQDLKLRRRLHFWE